MTDYTFTEKDEINIAGIQVRTSNQAEGNANSARIPGLWQRFYQEDVADKIPDRINSHLIFEAYTDYASDHEGEYTVVLGVEVSSLDGVPPGMMGITVPRSRYLVMPATGEIPSAVQEAWRRVWNHFASPKPHQRAYQVDFEQFKVNGDGGFDECHLMISVR